MGKSFKFGIILLGVSLVIVAVFWLRSCTKGDHLEIGADEAIDATPTQIQSIKAIGEWEFLSVSLEELADTVRKGFFSDDAGIPPVQLLRRPGRGPGDRGHGLGIRMRA